MLMRMQGNWIPHTLLVRTENGTAIVENSLVVSLRTEHAVIHDPAIALLGTYPRGTKTYTHPQKSCT